MTEQQRFVKKPVEISATQWFRNGDHPLDHHPMDTKNPTDEDRKRYDDYLATEGKVVRYYRHPEVSGKATCQKCGNVMHRHGWIDTLEGGHIVCPGDWIITGVQGEHYPCKPDIFEATYQPAGDQHPDDAAEDRFATAPAGELRPDCSVCGDFGSDCDVCGAPSQQPVSDPDGLPGTPRPMSTAPRDGTMVRLLVQFTNHGVNDGFDSGPAWTIGANTYDDSGDDEWHIAGWDWQQDCFTAGEGEPLGWLPMLSAPAPDEREIAALLERIVPRIDPNNPKPLDETEHCCECTLYYERERIHGEIARLRAGKEGES